MFTQYLFFKLQLRWIRSIAVNFFGIKGFLGFKKLKRCTIFTLNAYGHFAVKAGAITDMTTRITSHINS